MNVTLACLLMPSIFIGGCTELKPGSDRAAQDTCKHRKPPPRPSVVAVGGTLDFVVAVHTAQFGVFATNDAGTQSNESIGFDLDDTCTGQGQGTSCIEPRWATASHTDAMDGVDNASADGPANLSPLTAVSTVAAGTAADVLFRVRSYSGDADDDQVDVSLYITGGLAPRADGSRDLRWDGSDSWAIMPDSLAQPGDGGASSLDRPRFDDSAAYVSDSVLVARFTDIVWPSYYLIAQQPPPLHAVSEFVMAGNLQLGDHGWQLHHLMTGSRLPLSSLLPDAARLPDQRSAGTPMFCQSPTGYASLKRQLCPYADISSTPGAVDAPCDAISAGSLLDADPALLGGVGAPAGTLEACAGADPQTDTCDTPDP